MKLIVAEKPSVARDIARVLGVTKRGEGFMYGNGYTVTWAVGHLVSQCEPGEVDERWKRWNMYDLPILPEKIPLKVLPGTADQYKIVAKLMNSEKIESIICATDSAREGELIFRNIYEMSQCAKPVERLWISSMTDAAINAGFASLKPSSAYDALYESARSRSIADWLVGMNASRAFTLKYNALLSIGRVQTPTLNLIVKRDLEIENFVPQEYWEVRANFGDYEGLWVNPKTKETRADTQQLAKEIKSAVTGKIGTVTRSDTEVKRVPPPQLFDLTSLQREANKFYGFSADQTLKLAQSLYETRKALTYPRTDSRYLPDDMQPKIAAALRRLPQPYADMVKAPEMNLSMHTKRFYDNDKISDHHAIVPTERSIDPTSLPADERKIYDLVVRRLIAAHYPAYEYESAVIMTQVTNDSSAYDFKSNGSMPLKAGWKSIWKDDKPDKKEKDVQLPRLTVGDTRKVEKVTTKACKTKPPQKHTDASILSMMENAGRSIEDESLREEMKDSGLGTPATRAAIIERLIKVGYAKRSGKNLVSTEKGRQLIAVVPEQIASAVTTGKWEKWLHTLADTKLSVEERENKARRFREGIDRFAQFLVESAKSAPPGAVFAEERGNKKKNIKKES